MLQLLWSGIKKSFQSLQANFDRCNLYLNLISLICFISYFSSDGLIQLWWWYNTQWWLYRLYNKCNFQLKYRHFYVLFHLHEACAMIWWNYVVIDGKGHICKWWIDIDISWQIILAIVHTDCCCIEDRDMFYMILFPKAVSRQTISHYTGEHFI